ncbi:MAG: hypothetical protein QM621_11815 [Aeromicrobium sp.]|uniref:hypothetical protein n=1 Tax=Aeromicrobium sp. TaxID=1871063 RepID=UPI0039E443D3
MVDASTVYALRLMRGFGVPDAKEQDPYEDDAPVRALILGDYAPYPDCGVTEDGQVIHGEPALPFTEARFLVGATSPNGFVHGFLNIDPPWRSEIGTIHLEHIRKPGSILPVSTTAREAVKAMRLDGHDFREWFHQH